MSNHPKPPDGAAVTSEPYIDFLGNEVGPGDQVIVCQRDGNVSRMWLGECSGVAVWEDRWLRPHWHVLIQPVDFNAYSRGASKHVWEREENPLTGKSEPTGKRPPPRWIMADHVVLYQQK